MHHSAGLPDKCCHKIIINVQCRRQEFNMRGGGYHNKYILYIFYFILINTYGQVSYYIKEIVLKTIV